MLQTPAYARALAGADQGLADDGARERAVEATLARRKSVLGERKPDIHLVIGEAALHQNVGGREVMEGQFDVLAGVSGDSGMITVESVGLHSRAVRAVPAGTDKRMRGRRLPLDRHQTKRGPCAHR